MSGQIILQGFLADIPNPRAKRNPRFFVTSDTDQLFAEVNGAWVEVALNPTAVADAVTLAVDAVVDGAPGLLDTLNELAAAIGDNPSFITTVNDAIDLVASDLSDHEAEMTGAHASDAIAYDNTTSGLTADNVKDAIDEVAGAGGSIDFAGEVAEGVQNTIVNGAANGAAITGPTRDWVATIPGGDFASFDEANNRLVALQAGRYRVSWSFFLDANRASAGVGGAGVDIQGSVFGQLGRPTDFRYHPAANSDLSTMIDGSRIIDMAANEYIHATIYSVSLSGVDIAGAHQFGFDGTRMALEYIGPTP